jgi:TatD DNase family protein
MLTDSHCHLASHRFSADEIPDLLERANSAGVMRMISLATSLGDLHANLSLAETPAIHTCIGIHPCDVHRAPDDAVSQLAEFVTDPRVCAIGETGLDYYHPAPDSWDDGDFRKRQRDMLRQHFELASAAKLNIVIHTRDREGDASCQDALAIYSDYAASVRAVFHCFIGSWENAKRVIDAGGLVSFGGVVTFKNAHQVRDTLIKAPAGSFMIETDSPYLAPEPFRGKRNEPSLVRIIAEHIAQVRGETLDQLSKHTEHAAEGFFRLRLKSR